MPIKYNKELTARMYRAGVEETKREMELVEQGLNLYQDKDKQELEKALKSQGGVVVEQIDLSLLKENPDNHFHRIEGEEWENFTGSIREKGIITPLIVRPYEGSYQIVAGHNRYRAAIEVGLKKVPCIVKNLNDVEASVLIGITNNQRENTTDLEWGWAYRNTYDVLKKSHGGDRKSSAHDGNLIDSNENESSSHDGNLIENGKKTIEIVAEKYGVGKGTVHRKIRLTYLTPQLYNMGVKLKWPQKLMIDLSYLSDINQFNVVGAVENEDIKIDENVGKILRQKEEEGTLDPTSVLDICENHGEMPKKTVRPKKYQVDDTLFPENIKKKDREGYITKALKYIRDNSINLN